MKKFLVLFALLFSFFYTSFGSYVLADGKIQIIPQSEEDDSSVSTAIKAVGNSSNGVWKEYNSQADSLSLGGQFSSGIMNWDTILNYAVYLVKFLFQMGLFLGAVMIIYAGYLYSMGVFNGSGVSKGKTAIYRAIIGTLVVIFSYAIVKILTSMFL